jgi:acetoin utilization protein AcuB
MYVKDHMTHNPHCITSDTAISKALEIMDKNGFHRLPIVDNEGKLIGLVTEGLISESSGSNRTSLSIYELNYLLSKTNVKDIMIKDVITINPDALVEEAADKMRKKHVNVLPVVDEDNTVVGIITESDIFSAFMDLLGYPVKGTRFTIHIAQDAYGILGKIGDIFASNSINVLYLTVYHGERGIEVVVITEEKCPEMKAKLEEAGWEVTDLRN